MQALAPNSRRASQRQGEAGLSAPHPYATAPSPTGFRSGSAAYGRSSPIAPGSAGLNPHVNGNGSDSFLYGAQAQTGKNGTASREGTTATTGNREMPGGVRGMGVYDRDQMQRVGEQDEDGGHGRKGFWAALCCRA